MSARNPRPRRSWMTVALAGVLLLFPFLTSACLIDDQVDAWSAYKRVYAVHRARLQHCDAPERYIYLIPLPVKEPDVQACEADMLAAPCSQETPILSCALLMVRGAD